MQNSTLKLVSILVGLAFALPSMAKDVAVEQYNVRAAQNSYDAAQSDYEAASQLVKDQQQKIAKENALLKELLKKQSLAKEQLAKEKIQLDRQQQALDKAWNSGGK